MKKKLYALTDLDCFYFNTVGCNPLEDWKGAIIRMVFYAKQ